MTTVRMEMVKNVRDNLSNLQARATDRLLTLGGEARKAWASRPAAGEMASRVRPVAEQAMQLAYGGYRRSVKDLSVKAREAGRSQAVVLAGGLRRIADRLDHASKTAP